jgi:AcrR family transcriptional regulator
MEAPRRSPGRPPRISRPQIVDAARRISANGGSAGGVPANGLTMQAVADALGVSRKALHYYVGDRQGLLTLVVLDRFESALASVELPPHEDWQAVLRAYAYAFRDGLIQVGVAIDHTPLRGVGAAAALALAERVLEALLMAGFGTDDARRGLTALANIAQSAAQNSVQRSAGQHDYQAETLEALQDSVVDEYPSLHSVLESAPTPDDGQFDFELDIAIAGLERVLAAR